MPPSVRSELARDQFLQALSPVDLRTHTQLSHPWTLQEALEIFIERELMWAGAADSHLAPQPTGKSGEKPAWVYKLTKLIRAVSVQSNPLLAKGLLGVRAAWPLGQTAS